MSTEFQPDDPFAEIPPQITTEQLEPEVRYLANSDIYLFLKTSKDVSTEYNGMYSLGVRLFINKKEYEYLKVTRDRVKDYLRLEKGKHIPKHSFSRFDEKYLSLISVTKKSLCQRFREGITPIHIKHTHTHTHTHIYIYHTIVRT